MALISTWHCICHVLFLSRLFSLVTSSRKSSSYSPYPKDGWSNLMVSPLNPAIKEQHSVVTRSLTALVEKCGPGFFLTYDGTCVQCNCNGHSDKCLDGSGICVGCDGNTAGNHCETCRVGYIGNVVRGVPSSCSLCPCPLPFHSNNFAISCGRRSGVVRCVCRENYAGRNCERCAPGYYGNPLLIGSSCKKCNCHGNSDPNLIFDDCDEVTGHCRNCLRNTTGVHCERCAPGYYGDAILAKNCTECRCNKCGTESCDETTGKCRCKPGVTGAFCGRCQIGYHSFDSCLGCQSCECSMAAKDRICDPLTRQCKCQPGATGFHCERCQHGHWNYGPHGCQPCLCDGGPCDSRTGKCLEHPSDHPEDTVCEVITCDKCIWDLIDDLRLTNISFSEARSSFENISTGVAAHRHLSQMNSTATQLKVKLTEKRNHADLQKFQILNAETTVLNFQSDMDALSEKEKAVTMEEQKVEKNTMEILSNAEQIAKQVIDTKYRIQEMILQLDYYGKEHELTPEDMLQKLKKAEVMLRKMQQQDFDPQMHLAAEESRKAEDLLNRTQQFALMQTDATSLIPSIWDQLREYESKLSDLQEALDQAHRHFMQSRNTNNGNILNFQETETQLKQIRKEADAVNGTLLMAETTLIDTGLTISELDGMIKNVSEFHAEIDGAKKPLRERLANLSTYDKDLADRAMDYAQELRRLAEKLENDLKNTDANGHVHRALNASNVYDKIAKYISEANASVVSTLSETARAMDAIVGIRNQVIYQKNKSNALLEQAKELQKSTEDRTDMAVDKTRYRVDRNIRRKEHLMERLSRIISQIQAHQKDDTKQKIEKTKLIAEEALNATAMLTQTINPMDRNVKEWTQNLENSEYDSTTFDRVVNSAGDAVKNLTEIVPQLLDKLRTVEQKQPLSNLSASIKRIRELIAQSRNVASKVQVSMKFKGQSAVEVHPKTNLEELSAFTSMSLYMNVSHSDKGDQTDRFVLYLGNKNATSDYIGLAIKKDSLVYVYNLGNGEVEVPLNSKPVSSWPAYFSLIRLERVGRYGKVFLTVASPGSTAEEKFIQKAEARGVDSLLDLDPDNTVFYVGGVPPGFTLPASLNLPNFIGCIELSTLNDDVISLYNFKKIYNMDTTESPPCPRNKLAFTQSRAATYYFDGTGYAVVRNIERRGRFSQVTRFDLEVRTPADNALLLLMVNESMFFSLEMQNGYLRLHYDFGFSTGPVLLEDNTKKAQINDARYHEISVIYHNSKKMILVVDRSHLKSVENEKKQMPFTDIYIGGAPADIVSRLRSHLAVEVGFRGCAKGFQFQKKDFNLLEEPGILGISSGCPEESLLSRRAYFNGESYIASNQKISPFRSFEGGFNFRTLQPNGLLFYYAEGSDVFSVSMDSGTVFFNVKGTTLQSNNRYNDGLSHFIATSITQSSCQLTIDDRDMQRKACEEKEKKEQVPETARNFYFGGSPSDLYANFTGCISNAYLTRVDRDIEVEDFQQYIDKVHVSLHNCPIETPPAALRSKQERNSSKYKGGRNKKVGGQKSLPSHASTSLSSKAEDVTSQDDPHCYLSSTPTATQHAYQFGGAPNSHQEFNNIPHFFNERSHFSIGLRTRSAHGIIFYVSDEQENNFMALFLAHGRLNYVFNVGHRKLRIRSQGRYNDGNWHNVIFIRDNNKGRLIIDGLIVQEESLGTTDADWHVSGPFYVGGVPPNKAQRNIQPNSLYSFSGCLSNFQLNGQWISSPSQSVGVTSCFDGPMEAGTYFSAEGGYVILDDAFHLGLKFELDFEARPRTGSGILLHVHGINGQYLNLNMKHGQVIVQVHNGVREFATSVTSKLNLCDGKWHRIVVIRDSNVVQLDVDSDVNHVVVPANPITRDHKQPIFIGGVPETLLPPNLTVRNSYIGCVRNFVINKMPVSFSKAALVSGAISINSCPAA